MNLQTAIPAGKDLTDTQRPAAGQAVGLTVAVAVAAGSEVAANMDRGSVPSKTLLRGSTTELEEEEDVDEVLPFRLTFFVFDSVTCEESCTVEVTWNLHQVTVNQVTLSSCGSRNDQSLGQRECLRSVTN